MIQQINLYRDALLPKQVKLPARQMLLIVAGIIGLLILTAIWQSWQHRRSEQALGQARAELETKQNELTQITKTLEQRQPNPTLTLRAQQLEEELAAKRKLIDVILPDDASAAPQFSSFLEALGRQRVEPLWLTRIIVADQGATIGLQGKSLNPHSLTTYLDRLGGEAGFQSHEFGYFQLSRDEKNTAVVNFSIASNCENKDSLMARVCESTKETMQ